MKQRNYNQHCGLAYALDIIGERWTLLIIRELVAGPRRFTDLLDGLPGISTNLLTERLKSLEEQNLLRHYTLPPPAASAVYELTDLGRALEPALLELGRWGSQFVPESSEGRALLRIGSYALTFKTFFRPHAAQGLHETYTLHIGNETLQVQLNDGAIHVQQGNALPTDLVVTTDIASFLGLLAGKITPEAAIAEHLIEINGDPGALDRLLKICGLPERELEPATHQ